MTTVTLACQAMATRFEIVLHGEDAVSLRAAGEEALREVERLDARLSFYRPDSEISHLNTHAAREPVRVAPDLFALLQHAKSLSEQTAGAFDLTIAPLLRCWGFQDGNGTIPPASELARAQALVGLHQVHLNTENSTVQFARAGMMLDLGAIGKGYAVERAGEILRETGVASALIHGGTSTVYAMGRPPDRTHWTVAIAQPPSVPADRQIPITLALEDEALSVSAEWGKSFESEGRTFGHVLDPRSGLPVQGAVLAAVALRSATETDALSTALLVLGKGGRERIFELRPDAKTLLITKSGDEFVAESSGSVWRHAARQEAR
jgi:FAD:protein FMN transferase